ncbi:MAG: amino acid adenylation domain-containing protein [Alphaproteobacteria bacterium]|nr:amino acid adenylation domain-containing protein [Alphaproteobacteria bacterium]
MISRNLEIGEFLRLSFEQFRDLPAIWLGGQTVSYAGLYADAATLASTILETTKPGEPIGVLAQRSYPAYVGVLAALLSGRPYVPINMKFPFERQVDIASIARCRLLVWDEQSKRRCDELLQILEPGVRESTASLPDRPNNSPDFHDGRFTGAGSNVAYIMFTSGTTGAPKGVAVRRENLSAYLTAIAEIAPIEPGTRCTQNFDLSFDLSVHDIFQTWASGGCLYVMGNEDALDPVGFAKRHALQAWFSVPSVVAMARRLRRLQPDALPDMRLSLFCGEPLPASIADDWAQTAPSSRILNLYGPTEATIAITAEEYDRSAASDARPATIPLGKPFRNSAAVVVDSEGRPAPLGELWLGGAQISNGYINNDKENQAKFVNRRVPGYTFDRWYRTGDLVQQDDRHGLVFQGRMDDQAKIQGYRVELLEIEEVLRRASGTTEAAAVLWPVSETGAAEGVVGFVCAAAGAERDIIANCRAHLPSYAVPRKIMAIEALPLNANGKVDRNALRKTYLAGK